MKALEIKYIKRIFLYFLTPSIVNNSLTDNLIDSSRKEILIYDYILE